MNTPLILNTGDSPAERPLIFSLIGARGDLAWRLVMPALYDLYRSGRLPARFALIGVDRMAGDTESFAERLRDGVERFSRLGLGDDATWSGFAANLDYLNADAERIGDGLAPRIGRLLTAWAVPALRIHYLATPPQIFVTAAASLAAAGLNADPGLDRLVVEKPLGHDLASFHELHNSLSGHFTEAQTYRMDHFLGKETVRNILALRFANPLFEPIWNRNYVDHVAITVAETLGVEHRAGYYEHAGALRDMMQNHLLQIFGLVAMEPPACFDADNLRDRKIDLLGALRPIPEELVDLHTARGQYGPGAVHGKPVPGYRGEAGVAPDSRIETYAALKLHVDNWRWQDVPFYLRTGKRMAAQVSEVSIRFKPVPHRAWPEGVESVKGPVRLILRLHPDEGIDLKLNMKAPGAHFALSQQSLRFSYRDSFRADPPRPYETLLTALLEGDQSLFMRADQVAAAWRLLDPVLRHWDSGEDPVPLYPAGSWGPACADSLLHRDGRDWLTPTLVPPGAAEDGPDT